MTDLYITISDEDDRVLRRINILEDGSDKDNSDLIADGILKEFKGAEELGMKTYEVVIQATVRRIITVKSHDKFIAAEAAEELFSITDKDNDSKYSQEILSVDLKEDV